MCAQKICSSSSKFLPYSSSKFPSSFSSSVSVSPSSSLQTAQIALLSVEKTLTANILEKVLATHDGKFAGSLRSSVMNLETGDEKEYNCNDVEPCKPSLDALHVAGVHLGGSAAWQDHLVSQECQIYEWGRPGRTTSSSTLSPFDMFV